MIRARSVPRSRALSGVGELPGRAALDVVAEFLATKDLLLVLDNAEHLIDGVARVTDGSSASRPACAS